MGWLSSAFRSYSDLDANMLRVLSRSCWNINGSFVRHGLGLPLVLKAKPRYSFKLEAPGFFKAWFWIRRKRPYILAKAKRTCWHEDHTYTISKQFTAAQSLWRNVFGKRDCFLSLRHIQCRLFLPIAFLHIQKRHKMTMIKHPHKPANTGIWRLITWYPVSPVTDGKINFLDSR